MTTDPTEPTSAGIAPADTTSGELSDRLALAAGAFPRLAASSNAERAGWLTAIADELDDHSDELAQTAHDETHLSVDRLSGEITRTTGQLRLFAAMLHEGSYVEAIIDHADPAAVPPRPDLRRLLVPVGPVAVFAASNFPFAFSVAGGDTASALAIGCPVVVKAHEGHPRTSRLTQGLVEGALRSAGAPEGTFTVVYGRRVGTDLVQDPAIKAASFTGSTAGGRALFDLASSRPDPIPFYGELGSINPVIITEAAVASRGAALASGLIGSFTVASGQLCTKPGVVFVPRSAEFETTLAESLADSPTGVLVTSKIGDSFVTGSCQLAEADGVSVVAGAVPGSTDEIAPVVLSTTTAEIRRDPSLLEEHFGPLTLLVSYTDRADLLATIGILPGSLTGTIHGESDDDLAELTASLSARVGRVLFGGWPTGVAVTWSQHHGGPWPATTSLHTSVGVTAVRRFQRPIVFQDAPEGLLPEPLREGNPLGVPRRVDGVFAAGPAAI